MAVITPTEPADSERLRSSLSKEQGPTDEQRDPTMGFGARTYGYADNEDPTKVSFPFLRRIARDHGVAMGLYYTESPFYGASWYMDADDARAAAFADNLIRPIYGSTIATIMRILSLAYSPAVKTTTIVNPSWTYVADGEVKQVWDSYAVDALVWKPLKPLVPEACRLTYDADGGWNGIQWDEHYVGAGGFVVAGNQQPNIDLAHSFWAALNVQAEDGNPYGFARCAHVAPIFHMYRYIWTLLAHAFENSADPGPEVSFPKDEQRPDADENDETNREAALRIGRRKRSGSTIAIPSDVYEDFQHRTTNIPKWKISYSEVKTNFVALQDFLGYLETLKFRALMISEQSLSEGQGGTSSRNVAAVMSSQRDTAQVSLMHQVVGFIMDQLVRPMMAINMPWYQGRLEMRMIGFGKDDDDVVRQIFQLAGQQDLSNFGIDLQRLADAKRFPMLDHAERERQRQAAIERANQTKTPAIEPTQGRRALVTQTGFGEMVYHQLHDPIDLSSKDDGDFVASLPRTAVWEDRGVLDAARDLRSQLSQMHVDPSDGDRLALAVEAQRCLYRAYDVSLSSACRRLRLAPVERDAEATLRLDDQARRVVAARLEDGASECDLARDAVAHARNLAVLVACVEGDVDRVQLVDPGHPRHGEVLDPRSDGLSDRIWSSGSLRPLLAAPKGLEVRRERLDGEHLARYDEESCVVLLSVDLDPEREADFLIALGDRMAA